MAAKKKSKSLCLTNDFMCTLTANRIGIFFVALYTLCFFWAFANPVQLDLHLALFQMSFYGFAGFTVASYWVGLVQAYAWGWIVSFLWGNLVKQ